MLQLAWLLLCRVALSVHPGLPNTCSREGEIALTFDEGPSYYTGMLLNILKQHGIKATFHVTPQYLDNPVILAYLRRAYQDGHLIGMFAKGAAQGQSLEECIDRITKTKDQLEKLIGGKISFLRFPAQPVPSAQLLEKIKGMGMRVTTFNLDSADYASGSGEDGAKKVASTIRQLLDTIVAPARGSFVVAQRDCLQHSVLATDEIVQHAVKKGYSFVKLDACLSEQAIVEESDQSQSEPKPKPRGANSAAYANSGNISLLGMILLILLY